MEVGTWVGILGACQGIFLGTTILLQKRGKRKANIYLGLLLLSFSLYVLEFALYYTQFFYHYPIFIFSTVAFPLLFGPLLYFYIGELSPRKSVTLKQVVLHLIPFLLYILYLSPEYLSANSVKLNVFVNSIRSGEPNFSALFYLIEIGKLLHLICYLVLSIVRVKKTKFNTLHVRWIQVLIAGFICYAIVDGVHAFELYYFGYQNIVFLGNILFLFGAGLIYFIGYKTLQRPELFAGKLRSTSSTKPYSKSSLTDSQSEKLRNNLSTLMEHEQMFLDETINLPSLAEKLETSTHVLSQILNEQIGMSFFDFINSYRIEEAKKRLVHPKYKHLTIEGIAQEVGFRNKATFNSAFNKFVGITPSKFRARTSRG